MSESEVTSYLASEGFWDGEEIHEIPHSCEVELDVFQAQRKNQLWTELNISDLPGSMGALSFMQHCFRQQNWSYFQQDFLILVDSVSKLFLRIYALSSVEEYTLYFPPSVVEIVRRLKDEAVYLEDLLVEMSKLQKQLQAGGSSEQEALAVSIYEKSHALWNSFLEIDRAFKGPQATGKKLYGCEESEPAPSAETGYKVYRQALEDAFPARGDKEHQASQIRTFKMMWDQYLCDKALRGLIQDSINNGVHTVLLGGMPSDLRRVSLPANDDSGYRDTLLLQLLEHRSPASRDSSGVYRKDRISLTG